MANKNYLGMYKITCQDSWQRKRKETSERTTKINYKRRKAINSSKEITNGYTQLDSNTVTRGRQEEKQIKIPKRLFKGTVLPCWQKLTDLGLKGSRSHLQTGNNATVIPPNGITVWDVLSCFTLSQVVLSRGKLCRSTVYLLTEELYISHLNCLE